MLAKLSNFDNYREKTMLTRLVSAALILTVFVAAGSASVFANTPPDSEYRKELVTPATAVSPPETKPKSHEPLRASMDHLVAEAKAGRLNLAERPQIKPAQSNGLSTKTKIAIGVAIAAVVVLVIVRHEKENFLDGLRIF
jgi:hypothetical protein